MRSSRTGKRCAAKNAKGSAGRSKPTSLYYPKCLKFKKFPEDILLKDVVPMIDQARINRFVNVIERHKGFKRDYNLVFRHLVSEVGELDRAIYRRECARPAEKNPEKDQVFGQDAIAAELLDIIFLACYMAELHGIHDLNDYAVERMAQIAAQYGLAPAEIP